MLQLLKIEWLKIKNYRTFQILAGLYIVSIFGINYITHYIYTFNTHMQQANGMVKALMGNPPFEFPEVWQTITWITGFLLFIPGLLIIISITNEYSYKTHRQNVINGLTRSQFILVKMALVVIIALASTLFVFITALIFGLTSGGSGISFTNIDYIADFFIQALSYGSVALLFGVLFKRSGVAIGVFFLFVTVIERMLSSITNHYIDGAGDYFPLRINADLIPFPFFRPIVGHLVKNPDTLYLLICSGAYLVIYFFIIKRKFETDDL
jgi:ABC-2 type transport system permease protein